MDNTDIEDFASAFAAERDKFMNGQSSVDGKSLVSKNTGLAQEGNEKTKHARRGSIKKAKKKYIPKEKGQFRVFLRVRKKQFGMSEEYEYVSTKLSRLEAEIDARKSAKAAGWPHVSIVLDIEPIT